MEVKAKYVGNGRYVLIDLETGEVVDDAQGYGYKSATKAYAAWAYKQKPPAEKKRMKDEKRRAQEWWRRHRKLRDLVETEMMYAWKDGVTFGVRELEQLFEEENIQTEFKTVTLLKFFRYE